MLPVRYSIIHQTCRKIKYASRPQLLLYSPTFQISSTTLRLQSNLSRFLIIPTAALPSSELRLYEHARYTHTFTSTCGQTSSMVYIYRENRKRSCDKEQDSESIPE